MEKKTANTEYDDLMPEEVNGMDEELLDLPEESSAVLSDEYSDAYPEEAAEDSTEEGAAEDSIEDGEADARSRKRKAGATVPKLMIVCIALFALVGIFSAYKILDQLITDKKGANAYTDMAQQAAGETIQVQLPLAETKAVESGAAESEAETEAAETQVLKAVDFDALWEINEDVVAWIQVPGTIIDYPVAQGEDNDEYIRTLLDGSYHRFGTLFIDYRNNKRFTDDNTIIYGHHIHAGDMFYCLEKYKEQSFFEEHSFGLLYTPEKTYMLQFFAGIVTSADNILPRKFHSDQEAEDYIADVRSKSTFTCDLPVDCLDPLVTLYTCDDDYDDARYYLFAKLVPIEGTEAAE